MVRTLAVAALFAALAIEAHGQDLGRTLEDDPNAYVLVIQQQLAERGLYDGPRDGQLTRTTILALDRFCTDSGIAADCALGPLTARAANAIAAALSDPAPDQPEVETTRTTAIVVEEAPPTADPAPSPPTRDAASPAEDAPATGDPVPSRLENDTPDTGIGASDAPEMSDPAPALPDIEAPRATAVAAADDALPGRQDGSSLEDWETYLGSSRIVNGKFRVSGDDSGFSARQAMCFDTDVGRRYSVSADVIPGTVGGVVAVSNNTIMKGALLTSPVTEGNFEGEVVATAPQTCVLLVALTGEDPDGYVDFDNVVVALVE